MKPAELVLSVLLLVFSILLGMAGLLLVGRIQLLPMAVFVAVALFYNLVLEWLRRRGVSEALTRWGLVLGNLAFVECLGAVPSNSLEELCHIFVFEDVSESQRLAIGHESLERGGIGLRAEGPGACDDGCNAEPFAGVKDGRLKDLCEVKPAQFFL